MTVCEARRDYSLRPVPTVTDGVHFCVQIQILDDQELRMNVRCMVLAYLSTSGGSRKLFHISQVNSS